MKRVLFAILLIMAMKCSAQLKELIPVYRWYIPAEKQYCTVAEHEYPDKQLKKNGWEQKTFLFFAYRRPAHNRVAVYSWYNPEKHAFISVAEDEFTDEQMMKSGYRQKHLQYFAPIHNEANAMPVFRWQQPERHSWITSPLGCDSALLARDGYSHRTYQYFGVMKP